MKKFKEFIKVNKNELFWIIPIYLIGAIFIGARQKSLEEGLYWLSVFFGIPLCLMFGFFLTIFTSNKENK